MAALLTKTNRLSRIFNNSIKQVRQASYVSPQSQLVICFSIVSVQLIGILIWVVASPPGINYDYDDPKRVILQCKTQNVHLVMSFAYSGFLAILCTIYAVKTRKIPENFNEARFIGFTMYSICIIWIAFFPIYFGTTAAVGTRTSAKNNYKIQLTTIAMCISLSATVILCCLFMPKLRVVLLKPDKNVRSKSKSNSSATVKLIVNTHNNNILKNNFKDNNMHTTSINDTQTLNHPSTTSEGSNLCDLISKCENELSKANSVKQNETPTNTNSNNTSMSKKASTKSNTSTVVKFANMNSKETSISENDSQKNYQLADSKLYKTPLLNKIRNNLSSNSSIEKLKSLSDEEADDDDESSKSSKIVTDVKSKQMLIEKEMGEFTLDQNNSIKNSNLNFEDELTENAIKQVVEQCFDQLTKNNKITTACLSLSSVNKSNSNNNIVNESTNDSATTGGEAKNTLVEKKLDILNGPTNTILLSSKNDTNELYSLKITFV